MDNEVPKTDELKLTPEGKSIFPGRGFCLSVLLLFYIFLFYGSLTPFIFKPVYIGWNEGISQILATGGYVESQMDWYVNLFLGVPAGFFMLGVLSLDKKNVWAILGVIPVIIVCFLMAFTVERLQLYTVNRNCALSDIIAQTLGSGIGCVIWMISGQSIWDELRRFWSGSGFQSAFSVLIAFYFIALAIEVWTPFDFVYSLGDVWGRWKENQIYWIPFSECRNNVSLYLISKMILFAFLYVPMGIYFQWRSQNLKQSEIDVNNTNERIIKDHPIAYSAVFALVISIVALSGQFFIQSRELYFSSVVLAILASTLSCFISGIKNSKIRLAGLFCGLFAIIIAMVGYYWTPFNFTWGAFNSGKVFSVYQLIPLADYQRSHTITAVNRLLLSMEFSISITLILRTILGNSKSAALITISSCAALFTIMESGQLFLPSRTFTFSDIILQTLFSVGTLKCRDYFQNVTVIPEKQTKNSTKS